MRLDQKKTKINQNDIKIHLTSKKEYHTSTQKIASDLSKSKKVFITTDFNIVSISSNIAIFSTYLSCQKIIHDEISIFEFFFQVFYFQISYFQSAQWLIAPQQNSNQKTIISSLVKKNSVAENKNKQIQQQRRYQNSKTEFQ